MPEVATKSKPVVKAPHADGAAPVRLTDVLDRTAWLSDELLTSLETSGRAATKAVGRFVITVEDALPREVSTTSEVVKEITESGLEMFDSLLHTEFALFRGMLDSAAKTMGPRNGH